MASFDASTIRSSLSGAPLPARAASAAFVLAGLLAAACGSTGDDSKFNSSGGTTSSGASGASGGFGDGDGGLGSSGGTSGSSGGGCATTSKKAEKVPVDMVLALDTSFSMDFDSKWQNLRDALKSFVANPAYADLGIGLQFFPIRKQCSVADYKAPAVPLALQPTASGPIFAALDAQQMAGGTPIVPLLQGLTGYLLASTKPGRKPVLVLATDGVPDDTCLSSEDGATPNTLENAVAVADKAFKGTPSIATFVIGVGNELAPLNQIAAAGGTTAATLVDTGGNAQQALVAALDSIRRQAIPCDYDIPAGSIDVKSTNVTYTKAGSATGLVYVGNEASCGKAPSSTGWYFDNESAPKKVVLCKAVCDVVKNDDTGSIDLVFGCPRVEVK